MTVKYNEVFNTFPQLQTKRLLLREIQFSDADALFAYLSDEVAARFIEMQTYAHIEEAQDLIETWAGNFARWRQIRWGITFQGNDMLLGTCGFDHWNRVGCEAAISYDLARPVWGQGIMAEALRAVIAFGFERMNFTRIEATVWPENEASLKLLEGLGFQQDVFPTTGLLEDEPLVFAIMNQGA